MTGLGGMSGTNSYTSDGFNIFGSGVEMGTAKDQSNYVSRMEIFYQ